VFQVQAARLFITMVLLLISSKEFLVLEGIKTLVSRSSVDETIAGLEEIGAASAAAREA
jgi:hypothetical protein